MVNEHVRLGQFLSHLRRYIVDTPFKESKNGSESKSRILARHHADYQSVQARCQARGLYTRRCPGRPALVCPVHRYGFLKTALDLAIDKQVVRHPDGNICGPCQPALPSARSVRLDDLREVGLSRA